MKQSPKDTFVLVHGGFHGAWCWDRLKPVLEAGGFTVITPDQTGNAKGLYQYMESIGAFLEKQPHPVIVLGHSSGGMVISGLAKRYPHRRTDLLIGFPVAGGYVATGNHEGRYYFPDAIVAASG